MDVIQVATPIEFKNYSFSKLALNGIQVYAKKIIPFAVRKSEAIITISESEKKEIVSLLNIDPDKIFVTPLAPSDILNH